MPLRRLFPLTFLLFCPVLLAQPICPGNFEPTSTAVTLSDPAPVVGETITATATISPADTGQYNYNAEVLFDLYDLTTLSYVPVFEGYGSQLGGGVVSTYTFTVPAAADTYSVVANYSGSRYCTEPSQGSATFTAAGGSAVALIGSYAFLIQGTAGSSAAAVVGQFVADGKGNITSGVLDAEGPGDFENLPVTGTYTLDAQGHGKLKLTTSQATLTLALSVPVSQLGSKVQDGVFTTTGNSLLSGNGALALQTASSPPAGSYLFKLKGEAPCTDSCAAAEPVYATGQLTLNADSTAKAIGDQTIGSIAQSYRTLSGEVSSPTAATGRTALRLLAEPTGASEPTHFVLYPVDQTHAFVLSLDPHADFILLSGTLQP